MLTFTQAIARMEGFGASPTNRPTRNNNPGDIEYGPFAVAHGATRIEDTPQHVNPRFAYFPDVATGFAAMSALLQMHYIGMSVENVIAKYAPPVENDTDAYVKDVCEWTGLAPTTILTKELLV